MSRPNTLKPLLCLGLLGFLLGAQSPVPRRWTLHPGPASFEHLGTAQGLSQGSVFAIQQDRRGFLWFGTEDGLNRWDGYQFKTFRPERGQADSLSSSTINCLFEDSQGELWIGSDGGGLNRLDAHLDRFARYPTGSPGGFPTNSATCLEEDAAGNLWIGTAGQGLVLLPQSHRPPAPPSFRSFPQTREPSGGPSTESITALKRDHSGVLWIALDGELHRLETGQGTFSFPRHQAQGPLPQQVICLAEDTLGTLWMGAANGLYRLSPDRTRFEFFQPHPGDKEGLAFPYVHRLFRDREGMLWLGLDGGGLDRMRAGTSAEAPPRFDHFIHDSRRPESLSSNAVESIAEDSFGVLWVGTYYTGLNRLVLNPRHPGHREVPPILRIKHGEDDPRSLTGDTVSAILQDRRGALWVGTDGQGLNRSLPSAPGKPPAFQHFRKGSGPGQLGDDVITMSYEDSQGRIWLGTYTGGLVRVEHPESAHPRFRHYRYNPKTQEGIFSNFPVSMTEDHRGRLWVGAVDGGLNRLDPEQGRVTQALTDGSNGMHLSDTSVFAVVEDRFGTLWLGSTEGLVRLNPETGVWRIYRAGNDRDQLSHGYIRALTLDRQGILWIGTQEGGLNRLEVPPWDGPEPRFSNFGLEQGIPGRMILGILEDDEGQLWLCSPSGLARFDPARGQGRVLRPSGGEGQELIRNAFFRNASGELFFGSRNGLMIFHPKDLREDLKPPSVVLLDFQLFNHSIGVREVVDGRSILKQSLAETPEITLSYKDSVFSLEFAALHFVDPPRNRYAYRLDGLDQDWNRSGTRRFVTYTTLAPGEYTFRVKGSNCDGVWSTTETRLRIKILPPFWRRLWFQSLFFLCLAGGVLFLIHRRLRRHRQTEAHLARLVEERTGQLETANSELTRLATHDAMTGLFNYRYFETTLARIWGQALRGHGSLGLVLIDVDFFKRYNDSLGHLAGDACLRGVAITLENTVHRESDLVARYGGEEFVVVAPGTDMPGVLQLGERIRQAVQALALPHPDSPTEPVVTISLGCAAIMPNPGQSWQELVTLADEALYRAKAQGRNRVCG